MGYRGHPRRARDLGGDHVDLSGSCPGGCGNQGHYALSSWTGAGFLLLVVIIVILILASKTGNGD